MASVSARVVCEVEVHVGTWNGTSTFDELREQVRREGLHILESLFVDKEYKSVPNGRVVGMPRVKFISVVEDKNGGE